jgi:AbrB family looped-hinge helix DNA binding protein
MKTTIDSAGCLVIPREIRRQAKLEPGMALEVRCADGHVEIEPASLNVELVREGRFVVAVPEEATAVLTADIVERTRDALRDSRS